MALRAVDAVRLMTGVKSLAIEPDRIFGRPATTAETAVLRVLGARQVVQAVVVAATGVRALSALVDVLHGLSMIALLALRPRRYGEAAAGQIATAALLTTLEIRTQRR